MGPGVYMVSENGVEISSCNQTFKAANALSSNLRCGVVGGGGLDLMCRDCTSDRVLTVALATRTRETPGSNDWCLCGNDVAKCNWSSSCWTKVWKVR